MAGYRASLYYNYPSLGDVLIIVIDNEAWPDRVIRKDDCVGLYRGARLIGVNILNANSYLKLRLAGLVHNPNEPLINLVHTLIAANLKEDVVLVPSTVLIGKILTGGGRSYEVRIGSQKPARAETPDAVVVLGAGAYVLLAPRGTRLEDGTMSDCYLTAEAGYLIIGVEEEGLTDDDVGSEAYAVATKEE